MANLIISKISKFFPFSKFSGRPRIRCYFLPVSADTESVTKYLKGSASDRENISPTALRSQPAQRNFESKINVPDAVPIHPESKLIDVVLTILRYPCNFKQSDELQYLLFI